MIKATPTICIGGPCNTRLLPTPLYTKRSIEHMQETVDPLILYECQARLIMLLEAKRILRCIMRVGESMKWDNVLKFMMRPAYRVEVDVETEESDRTLWISG